MKDHGCKSNLGLGFFLSFHMMQNDHVVVLLQRDSFGGYKLTFCPETKANNLIFFPFIGTPSETR